jgi:hypothetical protein
MSGSGRSTASSTPIKTQAPSATPTTVLNHADQLPKAAALPATDTCSAVPEHTPDTASSSVEACKIASSFSANDPRFGTVYALPLISPAGCDFQLPELSLNKGRDPYPLKFPIGFGYNNLEFAAISVIVVQPDGKSYMLAALEIGGSGNGPGGNGNGGKSVSQIANELSLSLGYGPTQLVQPDPGSSSDQFATSTLFKKGSVIAYATATPGEDRVTPWGFDVQQSLQGVITKPLPVTKSVCSGQK